MYQVPHKGYLWVATVVLSLAIPALVLLVNHGGSVPFFLLAVLGVTVLLTGKPSAPRSASPEEKLLILGLALYLATIMISAASVGFASDAVRRLDTLLRPLYALPMIFLFIRVRAPEGILWCGAAAGAIIAGGNAIFESLLTSEYSRAGGATNPILYGNFALTMGFIAAVGISYFRRLGLAYTLLPVTALAFGLVASLLSGSRGGWVAIPVFLFILLLTHWSSLNKRSVMAGAIATVGAVTAVLLLPELGVMHRIDRALIELTGYFADSAQGGGTSVGVRLEMWQAAWDMFRQAPLLGGGIGYSFRDFMQAGAEAGIYHPAVTRYTHSHNEFLMTLATRGLIGFAGLLALWLAPAYIFVRACQSSEARIRQLGMAGFLLVVGFGIFGLTEAIWHRGPGLGFFSFYAAMIVYLIAQAQKESKTATRLKISSS